MAQLVQVDSLEEIRTIITKHSEKENEMLKKENSELKETERLKKENAKKRK